MCACLLTNEKFHRWKIKRISIVFGLWEIRCRFGDCHSQLYVIYASLVCWHTFHFTTSLPVLKRLHVTDIIAYILCLCVRRRKNKEKRCKMNRIRCGYTRTHTHDMHAATMCELFFCFATTFCCVFQRFLLGEVQWFAWLHCGNFITCFLFCRSVDQPIWFSSLQLFTCMAATNDSN